MKFLKAIKKIINFLKKRKLEIIFFFLFFLFSWWLMWHTFSYKDSVILVGTKLWSDFGATIPLIRSFSWGKNWPPEYPLFPGEPIRYHFLFHFLVGTLEKRGLPLDWALNLPSLIGFWGLTVLIYQFGKLIFKKKTVGFLAVIFFLFNGSLAFLEFFRQYPLSLKTINQIVTNVNFPSFGPYDGKIVSAFWNLNIYTNQRHLAAAYAGALLIVYLLIRSLKVGKKIPNWQILFSGFIFGLYPFFHKAVFLMIALILSWLFLCFVKLRRPIFFILLIGGFLALPQFAYQLSSQLNQPQSQSIISFNPGYLVEKPLNIQKTAGYWFLNFGLSIFLIPLGFFFALKGAKKAFLGFFSLFLVGNLFQFSPEIAANHKFFNLFLIAGNMFSAWAIYLLWKKSLLGKFIAPILIFLMIFSGIIDFFPVKNDRLGKLLDAPKNPDVLWIKKNTPPDSVFVNSSYIYHPASLAGRKIFLGWPYFTWSTGYDLKKRGEIFDALYETKNKEVLCRLLFENQIDYLTAEDTHQDQNLPDIDPDYFLKNFDPAYLNPKRGFAIYEVNSLCSSSS